MKYLLSLFLIVSFTIPKNAHAIFFGPLSTTGRLAALRLIEENKRTPQNQRKQKKQSQPVNIPYTSLKAIQQEAIEDIEKEIILMDNADYRRDAGFISNRIFMKAIANDIPINTQYHRGLSLLHIMIETAHFGKIKLLIENDADVNMQTKMGYTPLMYTLNVIGHLKTDINTDYDKTDLITNAIEELFKAGADPNLQTFKEGNATIHYLIDKIDYAKTANYFIPLLLGGGANIDLQNNSGQTALHLVANRRGFNQVAQTLLIYGANKDIKDNEGNTALDIAISKGNNHTIGTDPCKQPFKKAPKRHF